MNKHLFTILEYPKIKELLKREVYTSPGERFLKKLSPTSDFSLIQKWQRETTEMKNILEIEGSPPFVALDDIESDIKHSEIHSSILTAKTLLTISRVLECLYLIKDFFNKISDEKYPLTKRKIDKLKVFRLLEKEIKKCIDEEAGIVDDASPVLKKIRQQIRITEKNIRDKLEHMV